MSIQKPHTTAAKRVQNAAIDVAQVDEIVPAIRSIAPGRYHVDEISDDPLPSGHSSRHWGVGLKMPDGSVVIQR
jgi:hypothetical protein